MVTKISLVFKRSFIKAASPAHNMPPAIPANNVSGIAKALVESTKLTATALAHTPPISSCPSAPIFQTDAL